MKPMQILIALDQLINTFLGGYADETMSARCWRRSPDRPYRYLVPIINTIFFWQPEHCKRAYESELRRSDSPKAYR